MIYRYVSGVSFSDKVISFFNSKYEDCTKINILTKIEAIVYDRTIKSIFTLDELSKLCYIINQFINGFNYKEITFNFFPQIDETYFKTFPLRNKNNVIELNNNFCSNILLIGKEFNKLLSKIEIKKECVYFYSILVDFNLIQDYCEKINFQNLNEEILKIMNRTFSGKNIILLHEKTYLLIQNKIEC